MVSELANYSIPYFGLDYSNCTETVLKLCWMKDW